MIEAHMAGPFNSKFTPSPKREIASESISKFDQLIEWYEVLLNNSGYSNHIDLRPIRLSKSVKRIREQRLQENVLTPSQINTFTQLTQSYESRESYSLVTGVFITGLIQASHHANHNQFYLDVRSLKPIDALCEKISVNRHFHLKVVGELGDDFCLASYGGKYSAEKVGNRAGHFSRRGSFYLQETGDFCGSNSRSSYFYTQKTGDCYSIHADYSRFYSREAGKYSYYKLFAGRRNYYFSPNQTVLDPLLQMEKNKASDRNRYTLLSNQQWDEIWEREAELFAGCKP